MVIFALLIGLGLVLVDVRDFSGRSKARTSRG
jgi:hypothetical protein